MKKALFLILTLSMFSGCVSDGVQWAIVGIDFASYVLPNNPNKDKNEPPKVEQ